MSFGFVLFTRVILKTKKKSEGREIYATVINWLCQYHGGCGGPVSPRPLLNIIELNTTKTKKREGKKSVFKFGIFFFFFFARGNKNIASAVGGGKTPYYLNVLANNTSRRRAGRFIYYLYYNTREVAVVVKYLKLIPNGPE